MNTQALLLTLGLGLVGILAITASIALVASARRKRRPAMLNLLGVRGTMPSRIWHRKVKPVRGMYTWKEKGDFEADIYLDPEFVKTGIDGETYMFVDLDAWLPIRYVGKADQPNAPTGVGVALIHDGKEVTRVAQPIAFTGVCENDDEVVAVKSRTYGDKDGVLLLGDVWRRLGGVRLAQIRKDRRIHQINRSLLGWADVMQKVAPWLGVVIIILLLVVLVVLVKAV